MIIALTRSKIRLLSAVASNHQINEKEELQILWNFSIIYNNNFHIMRQSNRLKESSRGISCADSYKYTMQSSSGYPGKYSEISGLSNYTKQTYESSIRTSTKDKSYGYPNPPNLNYMNDRSQQDRNKYGIISSFNDLTDKDQKKHFRIRASNKDNMTNSRKSEKDEDDRDTNKSREGMTGSRRMIEQSQTEKQREKQSSSQILNKENEKQSRQQNRKMTTKMQETLKKIQSMDTKAISKQLSKMEDLSRQKNDAMETKLLPSKQISKYDQIINKNDGETKPISSMTNSTGTSDYSSSSLKNGGGSLYSFSTVKTIGLVGLNNIGNTCFMNSILQCMFNLPVFNDYFLANKHENQMKSGARVAEAYARTIKTMRSSTSRSQTPSQLKSAIGAKKSRFLGYSQQDAQQFLTALLQLLSLDLNRAKNPKYKQLSADLSKQSLKQISEDWWNYNKQREDSIVCDYFTGQVISRVVCSKCKNQSIAFDNIWDMALNFYPNDGGEILNMISNFLKPETISEDYYCSKCKGFNPCQRKVDFFRLPKILVFQIKRFSYGRYRKVKLNNRVCVTSTLDLSSLIKQSTHSSVKDPVYKLVGVVNHCGDIDFGHYTAECRNPINGKWYDFNDSNVHEIRNKEEFDSSSPYLLFYARKDIC